MKKIISWMNAALAEKEVGPAMTYYRMQDREIRATDGRITAGHPWPYDGNFLVSGFEFEKVLSRLEGEPKLEPSDDRVVVRAGRFNGTISTHHIKEWMYPGVENAAWLPIPSTLFDVLKSLRAFISDNPSQPWAGCVALENNNCYATNNIALAGRACHGLGDIQASLPSYAIDFIMKRLDGLNSWAWTSNYVAFRWAHGAWMRSQLVADRFPERAAGMVRESYAANPTQEITDEFRKAFDSVASLTDDTIKIYADHVAGKFKRAVVKANVPCEVPEGQECSIWGAKFLAPVISQATVWSPSVWPAPAPFRGEHVSGYVVGRREA